MREVTRLCNSLRRVGVYAVVTRRASEPYLVRWRSVGSDNWDGERYVHSIDAVRHLLLTLWR